jgi:hypothetical protein
LMHLQALQPTLNWEGASCALTFNMNNLAK